jgi:hypothetical protein
MKHVRSLRLESLEARQMLSGTGLSAASTAPVPATQLVLNGTLKVDYGPHKSLLQVNPDSSKTRSVQVIGQLGTMGKVHGVWHESVDVYGNYDGPDTLQLSNPNGSIIIAFFNQNSPRGVAKLARGKSYVHTQLIAGGTGAYAGAAENGSITLSTSTVGSRVVSISLQTTTS